MLYAVENGQVNAWAGKKMKDIQLEGNYFVNSFIFSYLLVGLSSENNLWGWIPIFYGVGSKVLGYFCVLKSPGR